MPNGSNKLGKSHDICLKNVEKVTNFAFKKWKKSRKLYKKHGKSHGNWLIFVGKV